MVMGIVILALLYWASRADGQPGRVSFAHMAAGEAPIALVGSQGYRLALCSMYNRLESPRYPSTPAGVLRAYYARPRQPTAPEWAIYHEIEAGADCPPIYYALSEQDRIKLGAPMGDYWAGAGIWKIHTYRRWPGHDHNSHSKQ